MINTVFAVIVTIFGSTNAVHVDLTMEGCERMADIQRAIFENAKVECVEFVRK